MATVHNAYYNSPWIADAARNLASALAPADPEKTLEMQREKWKFDRLQQLSQIEDEERLKAESGRASWAALLADADTKPLAPTSPGEAAYFSANPAAAGPAGMDDATFQRHVQNAAAGQVPYGDIMKAAGTRGSAFAANLATLDDKQLAAAGLQNIKGAQADARNRYTVDGRLITAEMVDGQRRWEQQQETALALELARLRAEREAASDAAKNERESNKTRKVPPGITRDIGYNIDDFAAALDPENGFRFPPDLRTAIADMATDIYSVTEDASEAQKQALAFYLGDNPKFTPAYDSWFLDPTRSDVDESSVALRDGKTLPQLQAERQAIKAASQAAAPTVVGQPPSSIAAPGSDAQRVRVQSIEEARALPYGGIPFIIVAGPRAGQTGRTKQAPMQ